jgi:aspartate racemase
VEKYGDYGYPEILIYSVNLEKYHSWRRDNRWDLISADLIEVACTLQKAGADFGLIATNTMHKVFDTVCAGVGMPLLHIIDETARTAKSMGLKKLGLLGTRYTMGDGFYHQRMALNGIEILVPSEQDQERVHKIIVEELVRGRILPESKAEYLRIIHDMVSRGVDGVILGCTEIPILLHSADGSVPLLDTAVIHANAALEYALMT